MRLSGGLARASVTGIAVEGHVRHALPQGTSLALLTRLSPLVCSTVYCRPSPFLPAKILYFNKKLPSRRDLPSSDKNKDEIIRVLHDSFGWALTKDRPLFESIFAKDDDFFTYFPDSSTVVGWSEFEKYLDGWMDPRNKAKGYEIRDLRVVISEAGDVAWFSAIVDDEGEFDGKPWGAKDIRWTGVLERRGGSWKICQQHMSEGRR
jgi:ketosteroid isomerase-like protein